MNRLYRIIRNVHCISTHQRFAIDALPLVRSSAGKRFVPWILYYHRAYLRGAVDPDIRFRDYHNHVIHVRDGYWGGAPRVAHQWYDRLQKYLRAERFRDAAHAAGVLSHYVTDVIQPLHTISTGREALVHRPLEWSVDQSYDRIMQKCRAEGFKALIELSERPGWLGSMMMHSARFASRRADRLIQGYRFQDGVRSAPEGLDEQSVCYFAELFALAITAVGHVMDRAAQEAESYTGYPIPDCRCPWGMFGATVRIPLSIWKARVRRRSEQASVAALADEYFRTGTLNEWLPAEIDIKQRVIAVHNAEEAHRHDSRIAA